MLSLQRVVSVVHGQVLWKPHVCVICAVFCRARHLLQCTNLPSVLHMREAHVGQLGSATEPASPYYTCLRLENDTLFPKRLIKPASFKKSADSLKEARAELRVT